MKPEPLKERYRELTPEEKICVLVEFSRHHALGAYNAKYIKSYFMRQNKDVKAVFIKQGQLLWREIEKMEGDKL